MDWVRNVTAGLLGVGLVVLAGCSPAAEGEPAPEAAPDPTSTGTPFPSTWEEATGGLSFDELVEQHRQNRIAGVEEMVANGWMRLDPDRELDVPLVRVVSLDEHGEVMVDCMAEAGFVVRAFADGSVSAEDVPDEQGEALNYAHHACMMKYPINPYQQTELPKEAARKLYRHRVEVSMPCLREQGVQVEDPPTEETWLDTWVMASGEAWTPYASLDGSSDSEYRSQFYSACPPYPADLWPATP